MGRNIDVNKEKVEPELSKKGTWANMDGDYTPAGDQVLTTPDQQNHTQDLVQDGNAIHGQ